MLAMRKHSLAYHYCTSQVAHSRATGMMPGRGVGGPLDGALKSHNMIRCPHTTPQRYHRVVVNNRIAPPPVMRISWTLPSDGRGMGSPTPSLKQEDAGL
jgi:hypothetical protein